LDNNKHKADLSNLEKTSE